VVLVAQAAQLGPPQSQEVPTMNIGALTKSVSSSRICITRTVLLTLSALERIHFTATPPCSLTGLMTLSGSREQRWYEATFRPGLGAQLCSGIRPS